MSEEFLDSLTQRTTTEGCVCCCKCRTLYGRPASGKITLEFCVVVGLKTEIDDFETIPNGLANWLPMAEWTIDLDPDSETRCKWVRSWVSPNLKPAAFHNPTSDAWPTPNAFTDGPGLPNIEPFFFTNDPIKWPWGYHYVFEDTRPVVGVTGNVAYFVDGAGLNTAWYGAVFDAIPLYGPIVSFVTNNPHPYPQIGAVPTDGDGPLTGPYSWPDYPDLVMTGFGNLPELDDGTVPLADPGKPNGNRYAAATGVRVRHRYVKGTDTNTNEFGTTTTDTFQLDTGVNATTVDYPTALPPVYDPIDPAPSSEIFTVVFRYRGGGHDLVDGYYGYSEPETAVTCKCVAEAAGENTLDVTFVPARPGDGDWATWAQSFEPDDVITDLPGYGRTSSWRRKMRQKPLYWTYTATTAGKVRGTIGNPVVMPLFGPVDYDGLYTLATLPPGGLDPGSRCMVFKGVGGAAFQFDAYSTYSIEDPLQLTFRTEYRSNYSTRPNYGDTVPTLTVNSGGLRVLAMDALEGAASSHPLYTAGGASGWASNQVKAYVEGGNFLANNATDGTFAFVNGYYGVGTYRITVARVAMFDFARDFGRYGAADLGTGQVAGSDGFFWGQWFDGQTMSDGSYEGYYYSLSAKKVTITNVDTGAVVEWSWVHTQIRADSPALPFWAVTPGTIYEWKHRFEETRNDYGTPGAFPFGEYTLAVEYFSDPGIDPLGKATKTNVFVDAASLRSDHGNWQTVLGNVHGFRSYFVAGPGPTFEAI